MHSSVQCGVHGCGLVLALPCATHSFLLYVCRVQVGSSLREGLLLGVVEHLLSIDADIKWQEIVDAPTGALRQQQQQQLISQLSTRGVSVQAALLLYRML